MTTATATATTSTVTSVYEAAKALGAAAFARGAMRVPALDAEFRAFMASEPYAIGDDRGIARLDGWLRGWDEANLAAPVEPVTPAPKLCCEMVEGCTDDVTHVDNKGFTLCAGHSVRRKAGGTPCRKLTKRETATLLEGGTIRYSRR